jgi:hypothetical protein
MNALHYHKRFRISAKATKKYRATFMQCSFTCGAKLKDAVVQERINKALQKIHPAKRYGKTGKGYFCKVIELVRSTKTTGHVVILHYYGELEPKSEKVSA